MKLNSHNYYTVWAIKKGALKRKQMGDDNFFDYVSFKSCAVNYLTYPMLSVILEKYYQEEPIFLNAHLKLKDCKGIVIYEPDEQILYELKDNVFRASFEIGDCMQFVFSTKLPIVSDQVINLKNKAETLKDTPSIEYNIEGKHYEVKPEEHDGSRLIFYLTMALGYEALKQNDEVEFEVIASDKKYGYKSKKEVHGEDLSTSLDFPVRIVDTTYVRTLVRSGQSSVKGHFRNQPFGSRSNPEYRQIWVNAHVREKHDIIKRRL